MYQKYTIDSINAVNDLKITILAANFWFQEH